MGARNLYNVTQKATQKAAENTMATIVCWLRPSARRGHIDGAPTPRTALSAPSVARLGINSSRAYHGHPRYTLLPPIIKSKKKKMNRLV